MKYPVDSNPCRFYILPFPPQLIEMMGSLIERPLIHKDFQHNYSTLIQMLSEELDCTKLIFDQQLALAKTPAGPMLNKNMPRVAGILRWANELRDRVDSGVEKMNTLNHGSVWEDSILIVVPMEEHTHTNDLITSSIDAAFRRRRKTIHT